MLRHQTAANLCTAPAQAQRTAEEGLGGEVGVVGLRVLLGHVHELQAAQGEALHEMAVSGRGAG